MWPELTPSEIFAERRRKFLSRFHGAALFVAGFSRPRNFEHNRYPYRAESHFLYFVGRGIEGAALLFHDGKARLFAPKPDPEAELWTGRQPSLEELSSLLAIDVLPLDELAVPATVSVLPPQDAETAFWLSDSLDRDIEPGGGAELEGDERILADTMIELRLRHDAAAIAQMRQAAQVTAVAHRAGMASSRPGIREAVVRARMEAEIIARGCVCAYGSIVTINGEVLHNERHDGVLGDRDLLLADVGAETPEGWASDVTRVWPTTGRFSGAQRELYEVVLASQLAAIDAVRPGVRYLDVHRVAGKRLLEGLIALGIYRGDVDDLYARGAAALFFPHGIGHLLGLDVHDMEDLGDHAGYAKGRERSQSFGDRYLRLDRDLEPGMVVTIEPGFYQIPLLLSKPSEVGALEAALDRNRLAEFRDVRGIRIEDDVLVTESGNDVLTSEIPKTLAQVEAACHA